MAWALRVTAASGVGSGVAISSGLVLTCWHVVEGGGDAFVRTPSGAELTFSVVDSHAELDVALLARSAEADGIEPSLDVVPRAPWCGPWPALERGTEAVWAESCTDEAATSRRMEIAVQRGQRAERRAEFVVERERQGRCRTRATRSQGGA